MWPLDVRSAPADLQRLLKQPTLTEVEVERVKAHFLLLRERLLDVIVGAGVMVRRERSMALL